MNGTTSAHRAVIVAVGEELLRGELVDTNSSWIATELGAIGVDVVRHVTVGDEVGAIAAAVCDAMVLAPLVIVTGGLGPTADDCTREGVALATSCPLEDSAAARASLTAYFAGIGRAVRDTDAPQTLAPRGARVLANTAGTAPGLWLELPVGGDVLVFPGVPRELRHLLRLHLGEIAPRHGSGLALHRRVLGACGMPESLLGARLAGLESAIPGVTWGTGAKAGWVEIYLRARGAAAVVQPRLERATAWVQERLGKHVYSVSGEPLAAVVLRQLVAAGETVAVAESCTGGRVAALLTAIPGSSQAFVLGAVTYSNQSKQEVLGVPGDLLAAHGAVSPEVARAMAEGVAARAGAAWGVGITGIAGPGGGTPEKPVGLVYLAIAGMHPSEVIELRLTGDRATLQDRAAQLSLWNLLRRLQQGRT